MLKIALYTDSGAFSLRFDLGNQFLHGLLRTVAGVSDDHFRAARCKVECDGFADWRSVSVTNGYGSCIFLLPRDAPVTMALESR